MKTTIVLTLVTAAAFAADNPINRSFDRDIASVEGEFVPLAEAMPAEAFNFAPPPSAGEFKGVRTFAQQVKHVAAVNYIIAAGILGEKAPVDTGGESGPDSVATKEQIVQFVKGSFAYLHRAMRSLTSENATQMVKSPFGSNETPRIAVAIMAAGHIFDHYGQMVVYARMNGIVPPASR